jgi:TatD DNase family protein
MDKTLVLHCRDDGSGEAARITLRFLEELGLTMLRIHRHCFLGSLEETKEWQRKLLNVKFGFNAALFKSSETMKVVSHLAVNKILLESDAPYLPPCRKPGVLNSPWHCMDIARKLAEIKNMPVTMLVPELNKNARHLYHLL